MMEEESYWNAGGRESSISIRRPVLGIMFPAIIGTHRISYVPDLCYACELVSGANAGNFHFCFSFIPQLDHLN